MRIQMLFGKTLREAPADAELASHQLALRAGLVRPLSAGGYAWLPLGMRVLRRLEALLRQELDALGALEVMLPVVQPMEIGQHGADEETLRFQNRDGRRYVLGAAAAGAVAALAAHEIESYRDLPALLYRMGIRYRDSSRPRGGLIGLRETLSMAVYSLERTADDAAGSFCRMLDAFQRVVTRLGLDVMVLEDGADAQGSPGSQVLALVHPQGDDRFVQCTECGYAATLASGEFVPEAGSPEPRQPLIKVATPDCKTIEDVAVFVGVPTHQTLKAVFFMHDEAELVFVVIRGDLEVSEAKLRRVLGGGTLRAATEDEIRAAGAEPGYASPCKLAVRHAGDAAGVLVVADRSITAGADFVVGANETGYHFTGANYPRDFSVTTLADIAIAYEGSLCGRCGTGRLTVKRAIAVAHCFGLGTALSERIGVTFLDQHGTVLPVVMSGCEMVLEPLIAATIESHHDDYGIIWPRAIAPFDVHVVTLGRDAVCHEVGRRLHDDLALAGMAVLLDDREERPGVKFADADLIGAPLRVTVSERALAREALEGKWRDGADRFDIPLADATQVIQTLLTED